MKELSDETVIFFCILIVSTFVSIVFQNYHPSHNENFYMMQCIDVVQCTLGDLDYPM